MLPHIVDQFLRNQDGVTMVEYALLAALIVLVGLGGILLVSNSASGLWAMIGERVTAAIKGALG